MRQAHNRPMSHEALIPGKAIYKLPARPSDMLRTMQFSQFFQQYRGAAFTVRTQDGWQWSSRAMTGPAAARPPAFIATFSSRDRLDAVIADAAEATLARVFLDGDLDIQGDFSALLSVAEYALRNAEGLSGTLIHHLGRLSVDLSRRLKPGRKSAPARNWRMAACPLNLSPDFFDSWLGPLLSHACADFSGKLPDPAEIDASIFAAAQQQSLDRICRALAVEPGDRLLDFGCGWGALALRAAQRWSADAVAITACPEQAEAAQERLGRLMRSGQGLPALSRRCSIAVRDLRSSPFRSETFDKIADVGLFGQVSSADLPECLAAMTRMLVPGGMLLLDRVTSSPGARSPRIVPFHGELSLQPLHRDLEAAEGAGFELVSVASLQPDFELTLRVWMRNLRRSWKRDLAQPDGRGCRAWLLWLVETAANLQTAGLQAHRILLRRPRRCYRA